jgi:hypothetical protein
VFSDVSNHIGNSDTISALLTQARLWLGILPFHTQDRITRERTLLALSTRVRDILTPMDFRERLRKGMVGFRRFGEQVGNMRNVRDHLDLAQLHAAGEGYILNLREDRKLLHRAQCDSIGAMMSDQYPKIFFETPDEATQWLKIATFGEQGWENCGRCGGLALRSERDMLTPMTRIQRRVADLQVTLQTLTDSSAGHDGMLMDQAQRACKAASEYLEKDMVQDAIHACFFAEACVGVIQGEERSSDALRRSIEELLPGTQI